jgi:hypothetical protein
MAATMSSTPSATHLLGGEWAGWSCSFDSLSGALQPVPDKYVSSEMIEWGQVPEGFEEVTTEVWKEPDLMERRLVTLLPEDGCNVENLGAIVTRQSFGILQAPLQSSLAIDVDGGTGIWQCETIFSGIGGERPRARRGSVASAAERTRVTLYVDVGAGRLDQQRPIVVRQERCWDPTPSTALMVNEQRGSRSGLDAAWVSSVIGMSCFGSMKPTSDPPPPSAADGLRIPGGVGVSMAEGELQISMSTSKGASWMRRRWVDGKCQVDVGGR